MTILATRRSISLTLLAATSLAAGESAAQAVAGEPLHLVAYVEARPDLAAAAEDALRAYREAAAAEAGVTTLREIGRPNRFAILGRWRDAEAYAAHQKSEAALRLATALEPGLLAPIDRRAHNSFLSRDVQPAPRDAIVVATHVDVNPPRLPELEALLRTYALAGPAQTDMRGFDVLRQVQPPQARGNHMTLLERWTTMEAAQAHQAHEETRAFRAGVAPLLGALYDRRVFQAID